MSSGSVAAAAQPHPIRLIIGTLLHMLLLPGSLVLGVPYKLLALGDGLAVTRTALQLLTGIVCIAVGVVLLAVCTWDFMVSGKGTPNPLDPPRILVRQRLYRYVRNPFYIAVVMMVVGEAFVFAAPVLIGYAAALWLTLQGLVLFYEEPTLRRLFGATYDAYCRDVPRWLPRLPLR